MARSCAGALLVGRGDRVLQIVITVIAAAFYNLFAELFGGVEITVSEDETRPLSPADGPLRYALRRLSGAIAQSVRAHP